MAIENLIRIDKAIKELRALEAAGVADAGPIVERLIAVRRGYCESPEACSHRTAPCNRANSQEPLVRH